MDDRSRSLRIGLVGVLLSALIAAPAHLRAEESGAVQSGSAESGSGESGSEQILESPPGRLDDPGPFDLERSPIRGTRRMEGGTPFPWGWQLAAFLGALAAAVAILRGVGPRRDPALPSQAVALLGALPLGGQHGLRVVRFGRRTLLVGISPGGCHLLAETNDPLGGDSDGASDTVTAGSAPTPAAVPAVPVIPADFRAPAPPVPPASRGAA